jgi:hypothetical protein
LRIEEGGRRIEEGGRRIEEGRLRIELFVSFRVGGAASAAQRGEESPSVAGIPRNPPDLPLGMTPRAGKRNDDRTMNDEG